MNALAKVPVTIVTGFLGAGKTTLIRHVLQNAGDRQLALIINEFGDVGVDGEILRSCGIENCPEENIVELANGCLCCTVADDFAPAIEALLAHERRPDHIIVETSGLALPKPLIKAFDWPAIRSRLTASLRSWTAPRSPPAASPTIPKNSKRSAIRIPRSITTIRSKRSSRTNCYAPIS